MAKSEGGIASEAWKGVAGAAAVGVFAWVMDWLKPLWEYGSTALKSGWSHLMASSDMPNWLAYAMSLAIAIAALRWALRAWASRKDNHKRFTQFNFMGGVWRWNFTSGHPSGLRVYCLVCDSALVYSEETNQFFSTVVKWHCEHCGCAYVTADGGRDYLNDRVYREIDRLIRTGQWHKHVDKAG